MTTLVTFHAHPDDEAIATGGVMVAARADGHRIWVPVSHRRVFSTIACLSSGSPPAGVYLWLRGSRQASTAASTM